MFFIKRFFFSVVSLPKFVNTETFGKSFRFPSFQGEGYGREIVPPQKILVYLEAFCFIS